MSTQDASIKKPPGRPINSKNVTVTPLDSQISFSYNSTTIKPLQPLVQVSFSPDRKLQISAVVFIASSIERAEISSVNQESVISDAGETQLDFFIIYDAPEVSYQTFNAYRVDFVIENPPEDLAQIETYLWDEDPVTSRGTVTTVRKD
ncbi:hypothetical protein A8C32_08720 [Flavivirga aquatica]|uniref:Uncharacterized protein n=1 Tax=Flavivirga aquatica TaxID=1849968 RepID=A0A1E5SJG3_9FLAO|nr:hypothetical protein [Flavivirga aquatica]OEJ99241.1 hypothetical protein A8C32_08720 [Flavivirga aquatica]